MEEGLDTLRAFAENDRHEGEVLDWFAAVTKSEPRAAQLRVQADGKRADAEGWDAIVAEVVANQ